VTHSSQINVNVEEEGKEQHLTISPFPDSLQLNETFPRLLVETFPTLLPTLPSSPTPTRAPVSLLLILISKTSSPLLSNTLLHLLNIKKFRLSPPTLPLTLKISTYQ